MKTSIVFLITILAFVFVINESGIAQTPPSYFDLRNVQGKSYVTSVKGQLGGTCWTHGVMAAMEGNLLLTGAWAEAGEAGEPNLAEYHLDWWNGFNQHNNDDLDPPTGNGLTVHYGGDYRVAGAYLTRCEGAVRDIDGQSYTDPPPRSDPSFHYYYPRDIEWYVAGPGLANIDTIKNHIISDGVVGTCMCYNGTFLRDNIHYQPPASSLDPNHAVSIVGWDDNKVTHAPQKGAWICKNSWGASWGLSGFFWISYYDKHCCQHPEMGAISYQDVEPLAYDCVYYHDYHGWRDTKADSSDAFNAFTVKNLGERLRAVGFHTAVDNVSYTVSVYDRFESGQLLDLLVQETGTIAYTGYHTVDINSKVVLYQGDDFYVALSLSDGGQAYDRTSEVPVLLGATGRTIVESTANPGESYYLNGSVWEDLYYFNETANFSIKAFTTIEPAVIIEFPDGLPAEVQPIGPETPITVKITSGLEDFAPGTAQIHYRFDPDDDFTTEPLTPLGNDLFETVLPNTKPGYEPEFYFSAMGDLGTLVYSPKEAPDETYGFEIYLKQFMMSDDFEEDLGWEIIQYNVTDGGWERGDPQATSAQPENDHSPDGTICFVTGKAGGSADGDDLDGGPAIIYSPSVDLTDGDAIVSFYVWFHHSSTGDQSPVQISVYKYAEFSFVQELLHYPEWTHVSFRVSDYIRPGGGMRVSIEAMDNPNDSIVEVLVDDFRIDYLNTDPTLWADCYSIPAATGEQINFTLRAGQDNANRIYLLLGSLSGTHPGIKLPGGQVVPLNKDFLTTILLGLLDTPVCVNFLGALNANGAAQAKLNVPGPLDAALIGQTMHLAYILCEPPAYDFASNPIAVTFE